VHDSDDDGWEGPCAMCGLQACCKFGRELCYCSDGCYRDASRGCEALEWEPSEAEGWLQGEGLGRWRRQLASFLASGRVLMTRLTEGSLRRAGVPRPRAKEVMVDVELLRRGAWAAPEPPRYQLPLAIVEELGQQVARQSWEPLLRDPTCRSFAALCKRAVPQELAWQWFHTLRSQLPWQDPSDANYQADGKTIPRRTIFTVQPGCGCVYKYSGVKVAPFPEPSFVADIRRRCVELAGLSDQDQPNSCNINLYRDGHDSVGWHTDDEELFEGQYNDMCILSLSLGASRTFQVKRQQSKAVQGNAAGRKGPVTASVSVGHGDLCTMEGRFQRYYLHCVPKEPHITEPRINLTWRWITKHNHADGCKVWGSGN